MQPILLILYALVAFLLPGYVLLKRFSRLGELEAVSLAPVVSVLAYGLLLYPLHVLFGVNVNVQAILLVQAVSAAGWLLWGIRPEGKGLPKGFLALFIMSLAAMLAMAQFEPEPRVGDSYWHFLLAKSFFGSDWYAVDVVDNFWAGQGFPYHPSYRPPLYNFMVSIAIAPEPAYRNAQLVSMLFGAMLIFPTYMLSRQFLGARYASATAVLTAFNPWLLDRALFVVPYVLVAYFTLLLFYFYSKKDLWEHWFYVGVVSGLGYLTHPTFQISLAAVAVLCLLRYGRGLLGKKPLMAGMVFLAISAPWFVRNFELFGNPLYTPTQSMVFAGDFSDYARLAPPTSEEFFSRGIGTFLTGKAGEVLNTFVMLAGPAQDLLVHGSVDVWKVLDRLFINPGCYNNSLFCILTPAMFIFMLLGFGIAAGLRRMTSVYLAVGLVISALLFGYNNPGGDLQFIPALIPLGIAMGCLYLEKKGAGRGALAAILLLSVAYSGYLFYVNHFGAGWGYKDTLKLGESGVMGYIRENTSMWDVVMSDYAFPINYYTGRQTVVLPKEGESGTVEVIRRYNVSFLAIRERDGAGLGWAGKRYAAVFSGDGWHVLSTRSEWAKP